jgi:hypothetical protein
LHCRFGLGEAKGFLLRGQLGGLGLPMSVSFGLIFVNDGEVLGDRRDELLIRDARKIARRPSLDLLYRLA